MFLPNQFALFNDRLVYGQPVLPDGADVAWTPVPNETRFAGLTVLSLDDTIVRPSIHRRTSLEHGLNITTTGIAHVLVCAQLNDGPALRTHSQHSASRFERRGTRSW